MPNQLNAQSKLMDDFTVQVDGLGCPFCAYGLEKRFNDLKGIKNIAIEMETGTMTFKFPTTENLSIAEVEKQVDNAGYTATSVEIKRADGQMESKKLKKEE